MPRGVRADRPRQTCQNAGTAFGGTAMRMAKIWGVAGLILLSASCASAPLATDTAPAFDPVEFFSGDTQGEGVLAFASGGLDARFTVRSHGSREEDGRFILRQTITWSDGREEERAFILTPDGKGGLEGYFEGERGRVTLTSAGSVGHLRHGLPDTPMARMEQFLYLQPDGRTLINEGTVRVLGIPFRRLHEIIVKPAEVQSADG
ncbi:DUF3833 family protein [Parvularcula marina]|uniref:DUF3833 family protein n=2 Tax=Parvularcula marina TaxID=2292771 RepID=A0A371RG53_9PROT|nr:DUF3833 family protein [Parvularcula marina]